MKRIISTIAAIILVFALIPLCAEAAEGTATMSSASASAGETVKLTVKLSGISGVKTGSVELTDVPAGIEIVEGEWLGNTWISNFDKKNLRGVFAFEEALGDADVDIFTLTLKVTDKASAGENRIGFKMQFQNDGGDWITDFDAKGGVITVKGAPDASAPDDKGEEDEGSETDPDDVQTPADTEDGDGAEDAEDGLDYDTETENGVTDTGTKNIDVANGGADSAETAAASGLSPLAIVLICVGAVIVVAAAVVIIVVSSKQKAGK